MSYRPITSLYACPHCNDLVEFLGMPRVVAGAELTCDCGGLLEPVDDDTDLRAERTQSALTFAMRGG